jgi:hypothetical protein
LATGLRVRLAPLLANLADDPRQLADGARISFELLGKPPSAAKAADKVPAKLTLSMELISRVRGESTRTKSVLAELSGEVEFSPKERRPLFTITAGLPKPIEDVAPDSSGDELLEERVLRFDFDAVQFAPISSEQGTEFIVKLDPKTFHYMEVGAELELSGNRENTPDQNDILDVFITDRNPPPIEDAVFIIQRDGERLSGAAVEIESPRGHKVSRTSDAEGVARVRGRSGTLFTLVSVREEQQELTVAQFQLEGAESSSVA